MSALLARLKPRRLLVAACLLAGALVLAHAADRTSSAPAHGTRLDGPTAVVHESSSFRIATFNIHSGVGPDRIADLKRTARTLRGIDLAGLNEVRSGGPFRARHQALQLGETLGQSWLFAPAERQWWHDHFGNALVTSLPVREWQRVPLATTRGKGYRNFVRVRFDVRGTVVTALITHLDRGIDRDVQLDAVVQEFLHLPPGPAILMGDLNSTSDHPHLCALRSHPKVVDCLTRTGAALPDTIDWIFARDLDCVSAGLRDEGASDHPLAWAELSLPSPVAISRRQ